MKKRSFFSGLTASLALATVALSTVTLTSCEKETFQVQPSTTPEITVTPNITVTPPDVTVEQPDIVVTPDYNTPADASALIIISVIDWSNGKTLATAYQPIATTDGIIAMHQETVSCPDFDGKENYVAAEDITVWIPALGKGQAAVIPVTFYVQSIQSVAESGKNEVITNGDAVEDATEPAAPVEIAEDLKLSTEDRVNVVIPGLVYKTGQEVENIDEINAYIDALVPTTKAYSNNEINSILKALVATYNTGIKEVNGSVTIDKVPANNEIAVSVKTVYETVSQTITSTIDGVEYTIPNVQVRRVVSSKAEVTVTPVNTHDGHDGHGNDTNAGGGAGGK